jgi:hypothetical protein
MTTSYTILNPVGQVYFRRGPGLTEIDQSTRMRYLFDHFFASTNEDEDTSVPSNSDTSDEISDDTTLVGSDSDTSSDKDTLVGSEYEDMEDDYAGDVSNVRENQQGPRRIIDLIYDRRREAVDLTGDDYFADDEDEEPDSEAYARPRRRYPC